MTTTTVRRQWHDMGGHRGYYEPVPPPGWEVLAQCNVVNEAGEQCRDIIARWLRAHQVSYRSGYLPSSNLIALNLYILVQAGRITEQGRKAIDEWFADQTTSTFSVMTGKSWPLNVPAALAAFTAIVSGPGVLVQLAGDRR